MRLLFAILLLAISYAGSAQDKIEGIGKFKLKKTTVAYLDTFAKEKKLKREATNSMRDLLRFKDEELLVELFPDTVKTFMSPSYTHFCKQARTFYIPKWKFQVSSLPKHF